MASLNEVMREVDNLLSDANKELEDLIIKSSEINLELPSFDEASCKQTL